jgi:hypothetical protein
MAYITVNIDNASTHAIASYLHKVMNNEESSFEDIELFTKIVNKDKEFTTAYFKEKRLRTSCEIDLDIDLDDIDVYDDEVVDYVEENLHKPRFASKIKALFQDEKSNPVEGKSLADHYKIQALREIGEKLKLEELELIANGKAEITYKP